MRQFKLLFHIFKNNMYTYTCNTISSHTDHFEIQKGIQKNVYLFPSYSILEIQ